MLKSALNDRPRDQLVLCDGSTSLRAGDLLLERGAAAERDGSQLAVALCISDQMLLARTLIALDGACDQLILLPPELDPAERSRLIETTGANIAVSDSAAAGMDLPKGLEVLEPRALLDEFAACADTAETQWVLATSGTTGRPKLVRHTRASLTRLTRRDPVKGTDHRWGLLYGLTRFAGVQVFLQALLGGSALIVTDPVAALSERLDTLAKAGCTSLSATPTLWRQILMSPAAGDLKLRQITLGGEIADAAVLSALKQQFPDARIAHIYASTEAGAGFSVTDGLPGFPARYLLEPPKGVAIKVEDGRLKIANRLLEGAYLGGEGRFADADGFVDTGDTVRRDGERYFFVGRANGCINVGGNKVHPEEIETLLLAHEKVAMAKVRGKKSPITGELVSASVVPAEGDHDAKALARELKLYCRDALDAFKRPAVIKIVDSLETSASGKVLRTG